MENAKIRSIQTTLADLEQRLTPGFRGNAVDLPSNPWISCSREGTDKVLSLAATSKIKVNDGPWQLVGEEFKSLRLSDLSGNGIKSIGVDDDGNIILYSETNISITEIYGSKNITVVNNGDNTRTISTPDSVTPNDWDQNGFVDRTKCDFTLNNATRLFEVTTPIEYTYLQSGIKYNKTTTQSITIADIEGIHIIRFNGVNIEDISNPTHVDTVMSITDRALVSILYWDKDNQKCIYLGEERHGKGMAPATHAYLHFHEGLRIDHKGFGLTDIIADGNGSTATAQFGVTGGGTSDEDLFTVVPTIASTVGLPIYHLESTDKWRKDVVSGFSARTFDKTSSTRLAYNKIDGGVGSIAEVPNNDFVCYHIFATTEKNHPMISVMGQAVYANKRAARRGAKVEIYDLVLNQLLFPEIKAIGTVIMQSNLSYTSDINARIVTDDEGNDWLDWRSEAILHASVQTDATHNDLLGRDELDAHSQYALVDNPYGRTAYLTTGSDLQQLINDDYNVFIVKDNDFTIPNGTYTFKPNGYYEFHSAIKFGSSGNLHIGNNSSDVVKFYQDPTKDPVTIKLHTSGNIKGTWDISVGGGQPSECFGIYYYGKIKSGGVWFNKLYSVELDGSIFYQEGEWLYGDGIPANQQWWLNPKRGDKADVTTLTAHTGNTNNPHSVDKTDVGLDSVNNTSDANKPISTATLTALGDKVDVDHPVTDQTPTELNAIGGSVLTSRDLCDERYLGVVGSPMMYGAVGDGITDDTTAFMDCIAHHKRINLQGYTYSVCHIILPTSGYTIYNGGLTLENITTLNSYILYLQSDCFIHDVRFIGHPTDTTGHNTGVYSKPTGGNPSTITNCTFERFAGFGVLSGRLVDNFQGVFKINSSKFINCGVGYKALERSEYCSITASTINQCGTGLELIGGNNLVDGCIITKNNVGIKIADGDNTAHSVMSSSEINHNTTNLEYESSILMLINNCTLYGGNNNLNGSGTLMLQGCSLQKTTTIGATSKVVFDGCFMTPGVVITEAAGSLVKYYNCIKSADGTDYRALKLLINDTDTKPANLQQKIVAGDGIILNSKTHATYGTQIEIETVWTSTGTLTHVDFPILSTYDDLAAVKNSNIVHFIGTIGIPTESYSGFTVATLPTAFRPTKPKNVIVFGSSGVPQRYVVNTNGTIVCNEPSATIERGTWISFEDVSFVI